jgi:hypothetical protein
MGRETLSRGNTHVSLYEEAAFDSRRRARRGLRRRARSGGNRDPRTPGGRRRRRDRARRRDGGAPDRRRGAVGEETEGSGRLLLARQPYWPDREGRLVLGSLPSGRYRLRILGWNGARGEVELEHPGPEVVRVVLE